MMSWFMCGISNRQFLSREPYEVIVGGANGIGRRVDFTDRAVEAIRVRVLSFPVVRHRRPAWSVGGKRATRKNTQKRSTAFPELLSDALQFLVKKFMIRTVSIMVESINLLEIARPKNPSKIVFFEELD